MTSPFQNKCPQCQSENQESYLYPRGSFRTLKAVDHYIAPGGKRHYHDSNVKTTEYQCSRGHHFKVFSRGYACGACGERREFFAQPTFLPPTQQT